MTTLFKEGKNNLITFLHQIVLGNIGLLDTQRPFVWPDTKFCDLFDGIFLGYPVGYFLFWVNKNIENIKGIGTTCKQKHPHLLIVYGHQRPTSLYALITGQQIISENYTLATIVMAFNSLKENFRFPMLLSVSIPVTSRMLMSSGNRTLIFSTS
jgi:hypothetical protein